MIPDDPGREFYAPATRLRRGTAGREAMRVLKRAIRNWFGFGSRGHQ
jgi:hypothetical protein